MRVSAMYRKPNFLMSLIILGGIGIAAAIPALADNTEENGGIYFKGPMATCLSRAKVVYPCVSLSPPSYQSGSTFTLDVAAEPALPLDSAVRERNWLVKLKENKFWNSKWDLSKEVQGMDVDFRLDHSRAGMNMNLGPMKFNVIVDEVRFSDAQFFLGIDRTW